MSSGDNRNTVYKIKLFADLSKSSMKLKKRKHVMEEMGAAYMAEGIITLAGSRMYTSMADTDEVIQDALDRFENVFKKINPNSI